MQEEKEKTPKKDLIETVTKPEELVEVVQENKENNTKLLNENH